MDDLEHERIELSRGEEIVGLYGKIMTETTKNMAGREFVTKSFVSLGFIMNQCSDERLQDYSSELVRKEAEKLIKYKKLAIVHEETKDKIEEQA